MVAAEGKATHMHYLIAGGASMFALPVFIWLIHGRTEAEGFFALPLGVILFGCLSAALFTMLGIAATYRFFRAKTVIATGMHAIFAGGAAFLASTAGLVLISGAAGTPSRVALMLALTQAKPIGFAAAFSTALFRTLR